MEQDHKQVQSTNANSEISPHSSILWSIQGDVCVWWTRGYRSTGRPLGLSLWYIFLTARKEGCGPSPNVRGCERQTKMNGDRSKRPKEPSGPAPDMATVLSTWSEPTQ